MLPLSVSIWSTMFCNTEILHLTPTFCSTIYFLPETGRWRRGCLWRRSRERRRWSVLQASLPLPVSLLSHSGEWGVVINIFTSGLRVYLTQTGTFFFLIHIYRAIKPIMYNDNSYVGYLEIFLVADKNNRNSWIPNKICNLVVQHLGEQEKFKHLQQNLVWPG